MSEIHKLQLGAVRSDLLHRGSRRPRVVRVEALKVVQGCDLANSSVGDVAARLHIDFTQVRAHLHEYVHLQRIPGRNAVSSARD